MHVTFWTWIIAGTGLLLSLLLGSFQLAALLRPHSRWTIENVYGGSPEGTDPKAYFAFNQGAALADPIFWLPLQIAASLGMLAGAKWGFLLALIASTPFWYSAIWFYVWDRDMGFRRKTLYYWVVIWGLWPAFGMIEGVYCFVRLL
ncbi:MAG: hypothetical protein QNJ44_02485 [Rhodobacter sp.]|nr:hypothetical protein [Rhodobacter sp.]